MRTTAQPPGPPPPYPAHWEADVVLRDGGVAHVRPITPEDAGRLVSFYERVSDESKYYRFFAPYPRLSDRDVRRFTHHDYVDRVGLAATVGDEFVATVRYDRVDAQGRAAPAPADRAEVAFLVQDTHQGRGLASTLLEHVAAVARERGIRRFTAEVLPANSRMIKVFTDAGYSQRRSFADGSVHLTLDLEPTAASLAVMRAREQRAEARSVQRLLAPRAVAVVGAGRRPGGAGRTVLAGLLAGGFSGPVYAVNSALPPGEDRLGGAPAFRSVGAIGAPVDLAVVAVPADRVAGVVADCGEHGVQGLVVLASGHSRARQRELVRQARSLGMRILGPTAFGVINTAPDVRLNASPAPRLPRAGRIGLFTQSAATGIAALDELERRGGGLSTFVSAGDRADVSGNDVLQYWYEDPSTDVVLMYLESLGNPRKFTRLVRRTAAAGTPVVVVRGGRHSGGAPPPGHSAPVGRTPEDTVSALLRQAGVIEAGTAVELVDTGLLLARQPLPAGPRVAIVGNDEALGLVAHDACRALGLRPSPPAALAPGAPPEDYRAAVAAALARPATDAVLVTVIPSVADAGPPSEALAAALAPAAGGAAPLPGTADAPAGAVPSAGRAPGGATAPEDLAGPPPGEGPPPAEGVGCAPARGVGPDGDSGAAADGGDARVRAAPSGPVPGDQPRRAALGPQGATPPGPGRTPPGAEAVPGGGPPPAEGAGRTPASAVAPAGEPATAGEGGGVRKPVLVAHLALEELALALGERGVPAFPSAERAARALAAAVRHAEWRARAAAPGRVPRFEDVDEQAAGRALAEAAGAGRPVTLPAARTEELLAAYGIPLLPARQAPDAEAAVAAARAIGFPVALKATAPHLRHRADLGGIRLGLATEGELRRAYTELTRQLGDRPERLRPVVQAMAPRGVDTVVRATVDASIGAVLSFGLAGPPSELLGDLAHRLLPVTDRDAAELVRAIRAAPMLFGWRGARPVDTPALEELLLRTGRLVEDRPEIAAVELDPVVVAPHGVGVLAATVRVAPPPPRADLGPRRLPAY
ncbi:GNAT family N-acetyltransferase [Streptomyces sp. DSM 44917]|uniref:GNAT family N-acetyltransferase n=1 Tax=Streptomyces boetiae TaxID=3075541 RepID=A0ABU2L2Q0_9ACTN|nr:GNAT family N-acetyltransferase [Streptomyces sp. DSM 44917]MDT0305647.1 GNAT family N-acetyltransferase [Streptomyces sp. DSM 44917]